MSEVLKIEGLDTSIIYCTTPVMGRSTWPAAEGLCKWIVSNSEIWKSKPDMNVLEIGGGIGVPSLLLAIMQAGTVVFSDYDLEFLSFFEKSTIMNNVQETTSAITLDWTEHDNDYPTYDLIVASDIVFDSSDFRHIAQKVTSLLRVNGLFINASTSWFKPVMPSFGAAMEAQGCTQIDLAEGSEIEVSKELSGRISVAVFKKDPEM